MERFAHFLAATLLCAGGALGGCGNISGSMATTTVQVADAPPGALKNDDPLARPVAVAWTSSRARRCGFHFDGAKLRTSYLAWEARQGASGEKLGKIEQSYDTTYRAVWDKVAADEGYCTDKKSAEIKADLQRHLAGDYAPNLPAAKVVAACGFFGCGLNSDQPFSTTDFWKKQDANNVKNGL
jgi:hypothetical protein